MTTRHHARATPGPIRSAWYRFTQRPDVIEAWAELVAHRHLVALTSGLLPVLAHLVLAYVPTGPLQPFLTALVHIHRVGCVMVFALVVPALYLSAASARRQPGRPA